MSARHNAAAAVGSYAMQYCAVCGPNAHEPFDPEPSSSRHIARTPSRAFKQRRLPCHLRLQAAVEFHKRFDPMYSDARNRIRDLGPFSHFASHMAQPKQQLDTFR